MKIVIGSIENSCRTYAQFLEMTEKNKKGECPFCHLNGNFIYSFGEGADKWSLLENPYPHKHTSVHLVMAPARHIENINEMIANDWYIIGVLVMEATKRFDLPGGGFVMRFGDPERNAGSIRHLHANILVPDLTGEVQATLVKDELGRDRTERKRRIFSKLHKAGVSVENLKNPQFVKETKVIDSSEWFTIKDCVE